MAKKIQKALREYLSKIKSPTAILSACKHPKTTSFAVGRDPNDREEPDTSAKLSDIDRFLAENFTSLYGTAEPEPEPDPTRSVPERCVAVLACSADPEAEIRRSMKEVVEARQRREESLDWAFMEDILMCYLGLNDKSLHGFVLGAFVDLVAELRPKLSLS